MRFIALCIVMLLSMPAYAATQGKATAISAAPEKDPNAVVVELFTSQGCSSCPPAQEYLLQLSKRPDVLTLEYHVDYWDQLKTILGGSWEDPFSDAEWTARQVAYNKVIMDEENKAFTPEMIVDGQQQGVGNKPSSMAGLIEEARAARKRKFILSPEVTQSGDVKVTIEGPRLQESAEVILLRLTKEASTQVKGGENKGETMRGHNIVRELMVIGTWDGGKAGYKFNIPRFRLGEEGCAVLLQDPETKQIYAGGLCLM